MTITKNNIEDKSEYTLRGRFGRSAVNSLLGDPELSDEIRVLRLASMIRQLADNPEDGAFLGAVTQLAEAATENSDQLAAISTISGDTVFEPTSP